MRTFISTVPMSSRLAEETPCYLSFPMCASHSRLYNHESCYFRFYHASPIVSLDNSCTTHLEFKIILWFSWSQVVDHYYSNCNLRVFLGVAVLCWRITPSCCLHIHLHVNVLSVSSCFHHHCLHLRDLPTQILQIIYLSAWKQFSTEHYWAQKRWKRSGNILLHIDALLTATHKLLYAKVGNIMFSDAFSLFMFGAKYQNKLLEAEWMR